MRLGLPLLLALAACADKAPGGGGSGGGGDSGGGGLDGGLWDQGGVDSGVDGGGGDSGPDVGTGDDADGDGFVAESAGGEDCDDTDAAVNPDAEEICGNGIDDDCDGLPAGCRPTDDLTLDSAVAVLRGAEAGDSAGWALAGGVDLTGDGALDLAVGSPGAGTATETYQGKVEIWSGPWTGEHSLEGAAAVFRGEHEQTQAGYTVAVSTDASGDGHADLIVGSVTNTTWYPGGVAWVVYGPLSGELRPVDAALTITSTQTNAYIGYEVAAAGDPSGDGVGDWLVSGALYDGVPNSGEVWVFSGDQTGEVQREDAVARLSGTRTDGLFGRRMVGPGDVDGDGVDDVFVSANQGEPASAPHYAGAGYLFLGPLDADVLDADADGTIAGTEEGYKAGWQVGSAGDQDGDGTVDLLLQASADSTSANQAGAVFIITQPLGFLTVDDHFGQVCGGHEYDFVGKGVSTVAGDVDGDGRDDLLLADSGTETLGDDAQVGGAYIVFGAVSGVLDASEDGVSFYSTTRSDAAGYDAAPLGDVTGDGFDDFAIGAPTLSSNSDPNGLVYIIAGGGL